MFRRMLVAVTASAIALPAGAMDPGEWQFTTTMSGAGMPKPQTMTNTRCIKPEEAKDPARYLGREEKSDCKVTPGKKGGDTYTWEVTCPSSGMRGTGSMRQTATTMESEMAMKGAGMEMRTQTTGRRTGPCK